MTATALLLALMHCLTFRSPVQMEYDGDHMVRPVYEQSGLDGVAVVWMESRFVPNAVRREPRGHTSYGLFQLDSEWHPQFRGDLTQHIAYGADLLGKCKQGRSFEDAMARYNGGTKPGAAARAWGVKVKAKRDDLAHSLWLRLR